MKTVVVLCFILVVALAQPHGQPGNPSHHPDGSIMCHSDADCFCDDSTQTAYCDLSTHRCHCRATVKRQATTAPPPACDHGNVCTCSDGSTGHCSHDQVCHCHHR